ncbi:MAG: HAD-IA family hydrolase [Myxococcota bacterium]
MAVRFVALDLGNVLCDLDVPAYPRALAALTRQSEAAVEEATFHDALWEKLEDGRILPEEFRGRVLARLGGHHVPHPEFDRCWNLIPTARAGADALVSRLRVPHAIWSNTDPIHTASLKGQLRAIGTAVHQHFSFLARARKPSEAYYRAGLAALGARPDEVLFIDDREDNRRAAAALGILVEGAWTLSDVERALHQHALLREAA